MYPNLSRNVIVRLPYPQIDRAKKFLFEKINGEGTLIRDRRLGTTGILGEVFEM